MTQKNIYVAMYRALDCLYNESPNEELGEYLSEANPYLFKDRQSADPAIESEFDEFVDGDISPFKAYECVSEYLAQETNFSTLFSDISLEERKDLCAIVEEEES